MKVAAIVFHLILFFSRWVLINGLEKHAGNQACHRKRECEKSKWGQQLSPGDRFKACEKIPKPRTLYCHNPNYGEKSMQHIYYWPYYNLFFLNKK